MSLIEQITGYVSDNKTSDSSYYINHKLLVNNYYLSRTNTADKIDFNAMDVFLIRLSKNYALFIKKILELCQLHFPEEVSLM
jgi:hypothetical protein